MTTIFSYDALPSNPNFAAGLTPPAAVAPAVPGRKAASDLPPVAWGEAVRTRDDEPEDEERREWYFRPEATLTAADLDELAELAATEAALEMGWSHA